jgi:hypothetical protein
MNSFAERLFSTSRLDISYPPFIYAENPGTLIREWRSCPVFFFGVSILRGFLGFLMFVLSIPLSGWVYWDARRKGFSAWLWAGVSFLFFPLGFAIYLLYRIYARERVG